MAMASPAEALQACEGRCLSGKPLRSSIQGNREGRGTWVSLAGVWLRPGDQLGDEPCPFPPSEGVSWDWAQGVIGDRGSVGHGGWVGAPLLLQPSLTPETL